MNAPTYSIRPFQEADLEQLFYLFKAAVKTTLSDDIILNTLKHNTSAFMSDCRPHLLFYVACMNSTIIGYSIARFRTMQNIYELEVASTENVRRSGVAQALITSLISECRTQGYYDFLAAVNTDNTECLRLIEKLGFKSTSNALYSDSRHDIYTLHLRGSSDE